MEWISAIIGVISLIAGIASTVSKNNANEEALQQQEIANNQNFALQQENLKFQKQVADRNFGLMNQAFEMQQKENAITRYREDTAFQRQVADLKNAGLSPLMVSGGSPASALTVGSAPQYDATGISSANIGLGNAINQLFKTKAEKAQLKGAIKANILSALGNGPINVMNSYLGAKEQKLRLGILQSEYDYYSEHGFKPDSLQSLFSDFIKGINGNSVANPTLIYNFGEKIRNSGAKAGSEIIKILNDSDNPTNPKTYENPNTPLALKGSSMTGKDTLLMFKMWHFPAIREKTKELYDSRLKDYYSKMPNLAKNRISEKDFIKMFYSKNPFLNKLLFGEKN